MVRNQKPPALRRVFGSTLEEADRVGLELRALLAEAGLKTSGFGAELLAREFMTNAIIHGNGRDAGKKVTFELSLGTKWIFMRITDEGAGFNWRKAKSTATAGAAATSGRGVFIGNCYARKVTYNRPGNSVGIWVRK